MPLEDTSGRRPLKTRSKRWAIALSARLAQSGLSPNAISVIGVVGSLIGGAVMLLAANHALSVPWACLVGAASIQFRLLCNMMDGLVAVEGKMKSKAGDLFNEAPDRIEDTAFLATAGCLAGSAQLGWACAAAALFTAYLRALGASLGQGQDFCGPGAKQHRMAALTLVLLIQAVVASKSSVTWPLTIGLWIILFLTLLTAARRLVRLYRKLP